MLTKPSEGYLKAKRQMVEMLDRRIENYQTIISQMTERGFNSIPERAAAFTQISELEKIRDYVRNGMLWNTDEGE